MELFSGGSVLTGPTPSSFVTLNPTGQQKAGIRETNALCEKPLKKLNLEFASPSGD